jgi:hypothetical protein
MCSPLPLLDAKPVPGPHETDGRRHAPRSIAHALVAAAEQDGRAMEALVRSHAELTTAVIDLMTRLLQMHHRDVSDLRAEGLALLTEIEAQMDSFARANGPTVANPVTRSWYLLLQSLRHATLLGPQVGAS